MSSFGHRLRVSALAAVAALGLAGAWWNTSRFMEGGAPSPPGSVRIRGGDGAPPSNGKTKVAGSDASRAALTGFVEAGLRAWADDDDPDQRDERTQGIESALARGGRTIADRLRIIESLPADLMDFAFGLPSFQQWMLAEPEAALEWMSAHPPISEARLLTLFQDWGEKNGAALRRYLAALPEGEWRQKAMVAASYEALPADPVEAIERTRQIAAAGPQTGLLKIATAEWARRDPEAAGRWVNRVTEPALRRELTGSLARGYVDIAPDVAATWVARWPDRAAAMAWVETLPDERLRAQVLNEMAAP